ncbi:hypothetical protein TNCV_2536171 [Trichonephila clavipes]|nr:hypothetical protein TNCV_2536171 [Trichonephila clavipes]
MAHNEENYMRIGVAECRSWFVTGPPAPKVAGVSRSTVPKVVTANIQRGKKSSAKEENRKSYRRNQAASGLSNVNDYKYKIYGKAAIPKPLLTDAKGNRLQPWRYTSVSQTVGRTSLGGRDNSTRGARAY